MSDEIGEARRVKHEEKVGTADMILRVNNLRKAYGRQIVIDGLTLAVRRGEFVCIVGRNGSGKTTLLNAIAGLTSHEGIVEVRAGSVGFASQRPALYPRLTVRENVKVFAGIIGAKSDGWVEGLVDLLGIRDYLDTPVSNLSHGTAKKVELLCALINDPELVLMDEPLVSLDYESRLAVLKLLRRLKSRGKTMVAVTHLPEILSPLCSVMYLLENGKLERLEKLENLERTHALSKLSKSLRTSL